jgi:hypothetical protein
MSGKPDGERSEPERPNNKKNYPEEQIKIQENSDID